MKSRRIELNLLVEDEIRTLDKLRSGEVVGAISMESNSLPGCVADYLGRVDYLCVASPEFAKKYFSDGVTRESLLAAPGVAFEQHDDMHERFVHQHFNLPLGSVMKHTVRSSEAFVRVAVEGVAYCLIPRVQIQNELDSGLLINLIPEVFLTSRMYWHHWALESGVLSELSQLLIRHARKVSPQYDLPVNRCNVSLSGSVKNKTSCDIFCLLGIFCRSQLSNGQQTFLPV